MDSFLSKLCFLIGLSLIVFHSYILQYYQDWRQQGLIQSPNNITKSIPQTAAASKADPPLSTTIPPTAKTATEHIITTTTTSTLIEESQEETPQTDTKTSIIAPQPTQSQKQKSDMFDRYVESVLNGQKPFFKNCYIRYLKTNTEIKGSILLSFNILPSGVVSEIDVTGGSIQDSKLHKCAKDVVERVSFRHFKGPTTKVFYPIEFL